MQIEQLEKNNIFLSFIKELKTRIPVIDDRIFLYELCDHCINKGFIKTFNDYVHLVYIYMPLIRETLLSMREITRVLIAEDFITIEEAEYFDSSQVELTEKAIKFFVGDDATLYLKKKNMKNIIQHDSLSEKQLFFDEELHTQIDFLQKALMNHRYTELVDRLQKKSLCKGVAALFYGEPGTGKTETAFQIARATGRSIYHVDISATKTCWFGESEKLVDFVKNHLENTAKKYL